MRTSRRALVRAVLAAGLGIGGLSAVALAVEPLFFLKRQNPHAPAVPTVETLAREIDWLERHVDHYGTIVAKHPDIWGESRLTKHRAEFERMMYEQLNQFRATINATQFRSDQAYLQSALAISAAAGGQMPPAGQTSTTQQATTQVDVLNDISKLEGMLPDQGKIVLNQSKLEKVEQTHFAGLNKDGQGIALEPVVLIDQMKTYLDHLHELRRINEGDDTSDSPGYALNLVRIPISVLPGKHTQRGYGAEITITATPVLSEALLPTTFRNLVINDVVDQLGLPVTKIAEGRRSPTEAEMRAVSILLTTATELRCLANAIRNPAEPPVYGLVKSLLRESSDRLRGFPGVMKSQPQLGESIRALETMINEAEIEFAARLGQFRAGQLEVATKLAPKVENVADQIANAATRVEQQAGSIRETALQGSMSSMSMSRSRRARYGVPPTMLVDVYGECELVAVASDFRKRYAGRDVRWAGKPEGPKGTETRVHLLDVQRFLHAECDAAYELLRQNPDLMCDIVDQRELAKLIRGGHMQMVCQTRLNFLQRIRAKYQRPGVDGAPPCTPDQGARRPVNMVRPVAYEELTPGPAQPGPVALGSGDAPCPDLFAAPELPCDPACPTLDCQCPPYVDGPSCDPYLTTTEALAWAILVESALLNDQLIDDMRRTAQAKECHCLDNGPLAYYLPDPRPDACESFNEYVRCRWPIIIFALDPVAQQQNIADAYSRKRELQLALAVGFASGQVSARNLTRYVRRLETDIETITLNQTIVGFSHGSDTFGWRFFPRVQPPPFQSNATVFFRDLIGGGPTREADRAQLELETGMRECVAIVLMPSFVPYIDFDTRSNWFCLNQKNGVWPWRSQTEISMADTMKLSRSIKSMHNAAQVVCDGDLYRDGETNRLLRRVEQLDKELPLQTMRAQIPYENTLGGFEMFNTGLTDLAPELAGWYGAPGILIEDGKAPCTTTAAAAPKDCTCPDGKRALAAPPPPCEGDGTTIFLIGDNFSVHDTKVIAGATCIEHFQLISRQIMRITIPTCVQTVKVDDDDYVDIHVATPYGVTSHLHIPVQKKAGDAKAQADATRQIVREEFVNLQPATESKLTPLNAEICAWFTLKSPGDSVAAVRIDGSTKSFKVTLKPPANKTYPASLDLAVVAASVSGSPAKTKDLGSPIAIGPFAFKDLEATIELKDESLRAIEAQLATATGEQISGPKKATFVLKVLLNMPKPAFELCAIPLTMKPFCDPCPPRATAGSAGATDAAVPEFTVPADCDECEVPLGASSGPALDSFGEIESAPRHRHFAFSAGMIPRKQTETLGPSPRLAPGQVSPLPPVYPVARSSQPPKTAAVARPTATGAMPGLVLPTPPRERVARKAGPASQRGVQRR